MSDLSQCLWFLSISTWLTAFVNGGYVYLHIPAGCVNGNNMVKYASKSLDQCIALCDARSDCLGFEYGVDYGGSRRNYVAQHCQLQSSADYDDCEEKIGNLDFYMKGNTTAFPTRRPTHNPTDHPTLRPTHGKEAAFVNGGYVYIPKGCVDGNNIIKYSFKSVDECIRLCDARSDCLASENGVSYGGSGSYQALDCQLQSSGDYDDFDGEWWNLDLYVKGYLHIPAGCVNGNNIVRYAAKSVDQCMYLCYARSDCLGFEYGVDYGGSSGNYVAQDCQLQSSADYDDCDRESWNLDFYVQGSVTVSPTRLPTPNPTGHPTLRPTHGKEAGNILSSPRKFYLMIGAIALLMCIILFSNVPDPQPSKQEKLYIRFNDPNRKDIRDY